MLTDNLGTKHCRNLDQTRDGGGDIVCGRWLIEVKRVQRASLPAWWRQAVASAKARGLTPCLWYRSDRKPWRIRVPIPEAWATGHGWREGIEWTAELSPAGFYLLAREGV